MPVTPIRPSRKHVTPWQLRIELLDVQPLVWRRLLVPSGITLPALHRVFQAALGGESRTFEYVYDFGDDWRHAVIVEERFMQPRAPFAPVCLVGENACPPEDIGGPPGYAQFLAEGGTTFDPTRFDREAVNRALATVRV